MQQDALSASAPEATQRKTLLTAFCDSSGYKTMEDLNRVLQVYFEQNVPAMLDYKQFVNFIRADDSKDL